MSVFELQTEHELKLILARCKVQSARVVYVGHPLSKCAECALESQRRVRLGPRTAKRNMIYLFVHCLVPPFKSLFKPCGTHNPNDPITVTPYWA